MSAPKVRTSAAHPSKRESVLQRSTGDLLVLAAPARRRIIRHALDSAPNECCGLLVGGSSDGITSVDRSVAAANVTSGSQRRGYEIDPGLLARELRRRDAGSSTVIGFYHSHPDRPAVPSMTDRHAAWPAMIYVIVPVAGGAVAAMRAWRLDPAADAMVEIILD